MPTPVPLSQSTLTLDVPISITTLQYQDSYTLQGSNTLQATNILSAYTAGGAEFAFTLRGSSNPLLLTVGSLTNCSPYAVTLLTLTLQNVQGQVQTITCADACGDEIYGATITITDSTLTTDSILSSGTTDGVASIVISNQSDLTLASLMQIQCSNDAYNTISIDSSAVTMESDARIETSVSSASASQASSISISNQSTVSYGTILCSAPDSQAVSGTIAVANSTLEHCTLVHCKALNRNASTTKPVITISNSTLNFSKSSGTIKSENLSSGNAVITWTNSAASKVALLSIAGSGGASQITLNQATGTFTSIQAASSATSNSSSIQITNGSAFHADSITSQGLSSAALTLTNATVVAPTILNTALMANSATSVSFNQSTCTVGSLSCTVPNPEAAINVTIALTSSTLIASGPITASITNPPIGSTCSYTQDSASTLKLLIASPSSFGSVTANTVTLAGNTILDFTGWSHKNSRAAMQIVTSSDLLTTQFAAHNSVNVPDGLTYTLLYTDHGLHLNVDPAPAHHFGKGFVPIHIATLAQENLRLQRQLSRIHERIDRLSPPSLVAGEIPPCKTDAIWSVYAGPIGSIGHVNASQGLAGNTFSSMGVLGGLDAALPIHLGLGGSVSYQTHHAHFDYHTGSIAIDFLHGNLYGIYVPIPRLSVLASLGYGREWAEEVRYATQTARGNTQGPEWDTLLGCEYLLLNEKTRLIFPIFTLQYSHTKLAPFTEKGADLYNIRVEEQTWWALWSFVGARLNTLFDAAKAIQLRPEVSLAWQRQWNSTDLPFSYTTFAAPFPQVFSTTLDTVSRDTLIFGLDLNCRFSPHFFIEFDYDLLSNTAFLDNAFYLQMEYQY